MVISDICRFSPDKQFIIHHIKYNAYRRELLICYVEVPDAVAVTGRLRKSRLAKRAVALPDVTAR